MPVSSKMLSFLNAFKHKTKTALLLHGYFPMSILAILFGVCEAKVKYQDLMNDYTF
jgi:hypothetical protein